MFLALLLPLHAADFDDHLDGKLYATDEIEGEGLSRASRAVVRFRGGTGFFVDDSGLILTNAHVARTSGDRAEVLVSDDAIGDRWCVEAVLVESFSELDLALYQATWPSPPPGILAFRRQAPVPGEQVAVVGYPGRRSRTITFGKVLVGNVRVRGIVSTEYDARTGWGSSGSPVLDEEGRVIAVHWAWDEGKELHGEMLGIRSEVILDAIPDIEGASHGRHSDPEQPYGRPCRR